MIDNLMAAASTPKASELKEGIDYASKTHGEEAVTEALKAIAREDDRRRLAAAYALRVCLPDKDFEAFAKPLLTDAQYQQINAFPPPK